MPDASAIRPVLVLRQVRPAPVVARDATFLPEGATTGPREGGPTAGPGSARSRCRS